MAQGLLIVPYGIEILFVCLHNRGILLLIVPYGIEIRQKVMQRGNVPGLLIVPYGIEI